MGVITGRARRPSDQGNLHANIGERAMALLTEEYYTRNLRGQRCNKSQIVEEAILRLLEDVGAQPDSHSGYRPDEKNRLD